MKRLIIFTLTSATLLLAMNGCGPSEEEQKRQEQARLDSLARVRQQQQLEQQRLDSIKQARQDSLEAARKAEEERTRIEFDENGRFAVQVESWRSKDKAEAQLNKWQERGYEQAYVVKYGDESRGDIWFRIRLGNFATLEMAEKFQDVLREDYNAESWISEVR